ncbi:MAG: metal ABC transporter ATP-binding protein [Phototrophicaceae bacterium]
MPQDSTKIPALKVDNLSAGYPGDKLAIRDVNFTLEKGEKVAVIGPNGAGKSTLFKAIVGLIPFISGSISIYGEDCRASHNLVGYVPQQDDIDWTFPVTVYDVIMMGRARQIGWFRWASEKDHTIVADLLDQLSLQDLRNRQIGSLSGGQKQRVFIARALAQETRILIMDEPFTGVDTTSESDILQVLSTLQQQGITIIMSTHNMEMATNEFDKLLLIKQTALAFGLPHEVMQADKLQQAYGGAVKIFNQGQATVFITDEHGTGD